MMHQFRTTAEMHSAGYAPRAYSIMTDSRLWHMPTGETVKTAIIPEERNERPNIPIAKISDIKKNLLHKKNK